MNGVRQEAHIMKLGDKQKGIKAIERMLGMKSVYSGPPTFSYTIGDVTVDRDGNVACVDRKRLAELERRLANEGVSGEGIPLMEGSIGVSTAEGMRNLINMIHSKQHLIGRAVGYKAFDVSDELVAILKEKGLTAEETLSRIRNNAPAGIGVFSDHIAITGLPDTGCYRKLAGAMSRSAAVSRWISPDETIEENEKFYMRAWLVRIGLGGADMKAERSIILKNLKGHTAFRNEESAAKWRKRR